MKRTFIYIVLLSAVLSAGWSCRKITDINVNPNKMEYGKASPECLLQELIMMTSQNLLTRSYVFSGDLIQHSVYMGTAIHYNRFFIPNSASSSIWNNFYRWAADAEHLRSISVTAENPACEGIGIIMKCLLLQYLTDMFGDIPCSEAFQSEQGNRTPAFDSQEDVYRTIISDLKYANSLLESDDAKISDPTRDLLYNGDTEKWRKFGNSLLLRCYMRLSNRDEVFDVKGNIREMYTNKVLWPVFADVNESAILHYDNVQPFVNYYGNTTNFGLSNRASEFMVEMMTTYSDPRLDKYYTINGTVWKGAPSGEEAQETTWGGVAFLNEETLSTYSSPFSLMRYDEVLFTYAEAAFRGWIDADPQQLYEQALKASVSYWALVSGKSVATATLNAFLTKVAYDGTLRQLITQKYIALFGLGFNAWSDYRRTGFPRIPIGGGTLNDHILPTRFQYPLSEGQNNPDSYAAALERLGSYYKGSDNMKTPVWWSQQAINNGIR